MNNNNLETNKDYKHRYLMADKDYKHRYLMYTIEWLIIGLIIVTTVAVLVFLGSKSLIDIIFIFVSGMLLNLLSSLIIYLGLNDNYD